ncbi:YchF/TatD family DNA exonuclease [Chitinophaga sp. SYP-B3965]|uniref:TatD family hydrolase n=1 Tax=Chitinophaga sp. SYP-B3965 TaxID=2663120 RepID=UPI0012995AFE|nr:TatD family hydrolase [Chitinophaga sp. SYP-B3965]MRG47696.1 YchF/TatD family DNA exonuclease [Chitinophaga sp. SYP-B3965]
MNWIDTHAHLYSPEFDTDRSEMVTRAIRQSVNRLLMPNIDEDSIPGMLALEAEFPEECLPMMGLHPCYVKENVEAQLTIVQDWLSKRKFWGVGEIGLDFYWDQTFREQQYTAFRRQIQLAMEHQLPIAIHSREATRACIDVVKELHNGSLTGVFHCFSGTKEEAQEIIDLGFYLGIGGVVTFKKAGLDVLLADIDLQHVVLETDAPYLAPVPYRGKRNESAYIPLIAQKLADIKNLKIEEVAAITTGNAQKLFKTH